MAMLPVPVSFLRHSKDAVEVYAGRRMVFNTPMRDRDHDQANFGPRLIEMGTEW